MPSRLADLIRKARRLAAERDRLIDDLAAEWTHALAWAAAVGRPTSTSCGPGWSRTPCGEAAPDERRESGRAQAWRHEAQEVMARVREKVEAALGER